LLRALHKSQNRKKLLRVTIRAHQRAARIQPGALNALRDQALHGRLTRRVLKASTKGVGALGLQAGGALRSFYQRGYACVVCINETRRLGTGIRPASICKQRAIVEWTTTATADLPHRKSEQWHDQNPTAYHSSNNAMKHAICTANKPALWLD
jgi:hypothetical protein